MICVIKIRIVFHRINRIKKYDFKQSLSLENMSIKDSPQSIRSQISRQSDRRSEYRQPPDRREFDRRSDRHSDRRSDELHREIDMSKRDAERLRDERQQLKVKIKRLIDRIELQENQLAQFKTQESKYEEVINALRSQINQYKSDMQTSQQEEERRKAQSENTLLIMKRRLDEKTEEYATNRQSIDTHFQQRETHYRKTITDLEEQIRKLQSSVSQERNELRNAVVNITNERDAIRSRTEAEFLEKLTKLTMERDTNLLISKSEKAELESSINRLKKELEECKKQFAYNLEQQRNELTKQNEELSKACIALKKSGEEKLLCLAQEHTRADNEKYTVLTTQHRLEFAEAESRFQKEIKLLTQSTNDEINTLRRENTNLKESMRKMNEDREAIITSKIRELTTQHAEVLRKKNEESGIHLADKQKELDEFRQLTLSQNSEKASVIAKYKHEIELKREEIHKLQLELTTSNSNFESQLKKVEESYLGRLNEKEQQITELTRQVRNITEESLDHLNSLERKLNLKTVDLEDLTSKYTVMKDENSRNESEMMYMRNEIVRFKDMNEKLLKENDRFSTDSELQRQKITQTESLLQAEQNKVAQVQKIVDSMKQNFQSNQDKVIQKETEITDLRRKCGELEGKIFVIEQNKAIFDTNFHSLTQDRDSLKQNYTNQLNKLRELERYIPENENLRTEVKRLREQLGNAEARIQALSQREESLPAVLEARRERDTAIDNMNRVLRKLGEGN